MAFSANKSQGQNSRFPRRIEAIWAETGKLKNAATSIPEQKLDE